MSLRLLFGLLASALPDARNDSEYTEPPVKENLLSQILNAGAAKFHVGMLSISLIVGLAFCGYVAYLCWTEKDALLGHIRNLMIALVCRTLFSIIFDGVVLLGSSFNIKGANTLTSFEQIFLNLVLAFWLCLTIYSHARVQRDFKSEPTLRLYLYGVPAVSVFFALLWIFVLEDNTSFYFLWVAYQPSIQWIVNSANLLFLLIQLALVIDMGRMLMSKSSMDNDSLSLLWRIFAVMGTLVFLFWLRFGLSLGPYKGSDSHLYFFYFVDGTEGTFVSVCLYFFNKWVALLYNKNFVNSGQEGKVTTVEANGRELLPDGRGIVTIDSMFTTRESGRWKNSEEEETKDVMYSNVVEPNRLQKTLELYKRFNVIPSQVTVVEGEQFYDCQIPGESPKSTEMFFPCQTVEEHCLKSEKTVEPVQKKNAFYSSKYLILDPKEGDFPKYLETRPSVSSMSERSSEKEERISRTASLDGRELVRMWLDENSENMRMNKKTIEFEESVQDSHVYKTKTEVDNQTVGNQPGGGATEDKSDVPVTAESGQHSQIRDASKPTGQATQPVNIAETYKIRDVKPDTERVESIINSERVDAEDSKPKREELKPVESVSSQPKDVSRSEMTPNHPSESVSLATPPNLDEPDEEDKRASLHPFLTYSELLEFRARRDSSVLRGPSAPTHSLSDAIFSKIDSLISVGSSFLTSIGGTVSSIQTQYETPNTDVTEGYRDDETLPKRPQHDARLEQSTGKEQTPNRVPPDEKYSDAGREGTKPSSDIQQKSIVGAEVVTPHLEGTRSKEQSPENDSLENSSKKSAEDIFFHPNIKYHTPTDEQLLRLRREAKIHPDLAEKPVRQAGITDRELPQEESAKSDNFEKETRKQQEFEEQAFVRPDIKRKVLEDAKHSEGRSEEPEAHSYSPGEPVVSAEDEGIRPEGIKSWQKPAEDEGVHLKGVESWKKPTEDENFERQVFVKPDVKHEVPKDAEHSEIRKDEPKTNLDLPVKPASSMEVARPSSRDEEPPSDDDPEIDKAKLPRSLTRWNTHSSLIAPPPVSQIDQPRRKEPSRNLIASDVRGDKPDPLDTSSESEFSIERRQSRSSEFSVEQMNISGRKLYVDELDESPSDADTQMGPLERPNSEGSTPRSSSSVEPFSIENYCLNMMAVTAKFQQPLSPLYTKYK